MPVKVLNWSGVSLIMSVRGIQPFLSPHIIIKIHFKHPWKYKKYIQSWVFPKGSECVGAFGKSICNLYSICCLSLITYHLAQHLCWTTWDVLLLDREETQSASSATHCFFLLLSWKINLGMLVNVPSNPRWKWKYISIYNTDTYFPYLLEDIIILL